MDAQEILAQLRALDPVLVIAVGAALLLGMLIGAAIAAKAGGAKHLRGRLEEAQTELSESRLALRAAGEARAAAETRLEEVTAFAERQEAERQRAEADGRAADARRIEAERQVALAQHEVRAGERRMADWETAHKQSVLAAKAAVQETATAVSNKLLTDHKREAEEAKKQSEALVQKTTQKLFDDFKGVASSVEALRGQLLKNDEAVDTVYRALSNPGGAGRFAEIGLENTLKNFGLMPGQDFVMQYAAAGDEDGGSLRPDAVVFLPREEALVVDSKASKFVMDLAEAEGETAEAEAAAKLAGTMNQHLKELASKPYRKAVTAAYERSERPGKLRRVVSVMYLPNEAALEKLRDADPDFMDKAHRQDIIPVGPSGLAALMSISRFEIDQAKQEENHEHIIEAAGNLLESVSVVLGHMEGMGKSLKSAAAKYQEMTASMNSRFLPRARRMAKLGVRPDKAEALNRALPAFQVLEHHGDATVEVEAEEGAGSTSSTTASPAPAAPPRLTVLGGREEE